MYYTIKTLKEMYNIIKNPCHIQTPLLNLLLSDHLDARGGTSPRALAPRRVGGAGVRAPCPITVLKVSTQPLTFELTEIFLIVRHCVLLFRLARLVLSRLPRVCLRVVREQFEQDLLLTSVQVEFSHRRDWVRPWYCHTWLSVTVMFNGHGAAAWFWS
jgi:hypothetical protein